MLRAKRRFVEETLMPQFNAIHAELTRHFDEIAETVIERAVHRDLAEPPEVKEPKQLALPTT